MAISEFKKLSGLQKGKKVGSGVYGKVYEIKGKPGLVVKQQPRKYFRQEAPMIMKFSRYNLTPRIRGLIQGKRQGYIIQDKYNGTLGNIINGNVKNTTLKHKDRKQIKKLVQKMHARKLLHMNLHADNIVYKKTPRGLKFKIIDAGHSIEIKKPMRSVKNVIKEVNRHANHHKHEVEERETQFYSLRPPYHYDIHTSNRSLKY